MLPAEVLDIPKGKDITLDLNGKTLTLKSDHAYIYCLIKVQAGGSLTIQSTGERGTLKSIYFGSSQFTNASIMVGKGGNLTVDNVTIAADDPLNWQSLILSELGNVSIRNAELVTTERTSSDTIGGKYCLDAQLGNEGEDGQVTITDSKLVGVLQLDYEAVDASTRQTRATLTNVTMDGDIDILGNRDPSRPWYYPIQINSGTVSGDICLDYHYRYTDFENDEFGQFYENHETQDAFDAQIDGAIQTLFGPNSVVVNTRGEIFTDMAMNAGELYTWSKYHPSNSVGTVQKSDPWCPVIALPVTIYTPDQFMKEVTLDGEKIEWGKDWKSEVHYLDNGKDHNLTFTWDPLPEALTKAGVTYDAYLKYQKPDSSEWYYQACRPGNDYITFNLPKDYPTGFYGFDLILNLKDKEDKLLGASFNEHIVRIFLLNETSTSYVKFSDVVTVDEAPPTASAVGSGYTVDSIGWFTDSGCSTQATAFTEGTAYYAKVVLKSSGNHVFVNDEDLGYPVVIPLCDGDNDNYSIVGRPTISDSGKTLTFVAKSTAITPFVWESVNTADMTHTIGTTGVNLHAKAVGGDVSQYRYITYKLYTQKDGETTVVKSATTQDEFAPVFWPAEAGVYQCWFEATRGFDTITSTPFTLTVSAPGLPINNQSGDFTIMQGGYARLFVIVGSVVGGVDYQWQVKSGASWTDLPGETNYDYRAEPEEIGDHIYRCKLTNNYGEVGYSNEMTVTVLENETLGRTPVYILPAVNEAAPDPAVLWPDKVIDYYDLQDQILTKKAEFNVNAGDTFRANANYSHIPGGEGYKLELPSGTQKGLYYKDFDSDEEDTALLGTITYKWEATTEVDQWGFPTKYTELGTDPIINFSIPEGVETYWGKLTITNTIGTGDNVESKSSYVEITFHVDQPGVGTAVSGSVVSYGEDDPVTVQLINSSAYQGRYIRAGV